MSHLQALPVLIWAECGADQQRIDDPPSQAEKERLARRQLEASDRCHALQVETLRCNNAFVSEWVCWGCAVPVPWPGCATSSEVSKPRPARSAESNQSTGCGPAVCGSMKLWRGMRIECEGAHSSGGTHLQPTPVWYCHRSDAYMHNTTHKLQNIETYAEFLTARLTVHLRKQQDGGASKRTQPGSKMCYLASARPAEPQANNDAAAVEP